MPPFHSRSTGAARMAEISSSGDSAVTPSPSPSTAAASRRELDRLGRPRPDAAAGRDQRLVVVGPGRAGQREQPLPLGEADRRVRVGVDEHVPVVERGHQLDVPRQQHAVAEHVAGHVADADHGEVVGVHVDAQGLEVEPHRLPGAAGGDAHLLVVVALRAARGEGVAQPEPAAGARSRWRCRRTSPCPCPPPPPGTGRRRRAGPPRRAARPGPPPGCRSRPAWR